MLCFAEVEKLNWISQTVESIVSAVKLEKFKIKEIQNTLCHNQNTVKPVYNGHPRDPKKVAVVQSWPAFGGFSIKIDIKISLAGLRLAVVDRWPLTQV